MFRRYRLQAATDSLFSSIVKDSTFAAGSCTLSNLSNISTYYWHVLATGIGGTSPWSSTWNFTTIYYPPPLPTLSAARNRFIQPADQPDPELEFGRQRQHSGRSRCPPAAPFHSFFIQDSLLTATVQPVSGLANYTIYYWRVDAGNSLGGRSSWTGAWSFVTTPAAPVPALPTNGAFGPADHRSPLTGDRLPGAASYSLQVSTVINFSSDGSEPRRGLPQIPPTVSGLANSTSYYWQVNTIVPGGISAWSGVWSFWTIFAPPVLMALPTNGATVHGSPSRHELGSGSGRNILPAADFNGFDLFNNLLQPGRLDINLGYARQDSPILPIYYWMVNAANAGGTSLWSGMWSFTTAAHLAVPTVQRLVHVLPEHPSCGFINHWRFRQAQGVYSCHGRERQPLLAGRLA